MNKKSNIFFIAITIVALFLSGIALFPNKAYAISASVPMNPSASSVNIGDQFTVSFSIQPTSGMGTCQGTLQIPAGLELVSASCSLGAFGNGSFVYFNTDGNLPTGASGTITFKAITAGNKSIGLAVKLTGTTSQDQSSASGSTSVYVRTEVETQQIKDNEEAARKAEEAARRAEQASIAAKMAEEASRKASEEAIRNKEVAESASVAESIRESEEESRSLEESVAESIKASESEEAKTRATEIEDVGYALLTWGKNLGTENEPAYEHQFFAAVQDNEMKIPAGYKNANLIVNKNKVLALKKDGMDENTYLVYGMFKENEEPLWYYYNTTENSFFPYEYLNSDTVFEDNPVEKDDATSLSGEMKRDTLIDLGFTGLVGALAGVFVTLLCKPGSYNKKSNNHRDDAPDDREDEE